MPAWMIRAGSNGAYETDALENERSYINYSLNRDIRCFSRDTLCNHLRNLPEYLNSDRDPARRAGQNASQLMIFAHEVDIDDIVVLPRYQIHPRVVAVGYITGDYSFRPDLSDAGPGFPGPHTRDVNWLVSDVPLANFPADLRDILELQGTVRRISTHNAENRIRQIVDDHIGHIG